MIETILEIAQILLGLLFFLFLPGYFVTLLFFKEFKDMEKLLLSILFSLMIGMSIGVFFGYDRAQAARTGGFTGENVWIAELLVTAGLGFILVITRMIQKRIKHLNHVKKLEHLKANKQEHTSKVKKTKNESTRKTKKSTRK